jgi:hypothetical protein
MSVFLNSTSQSDGALLNGSVALFGATGSYGVYEASVVAYRSESQGNEQGLEFAAGGQFVGIWDAGGTYLEAGDSGFTFRWKIWARGTGTLAFTQDTDPTWSIATLPVVGIGTVDVSAGSWTLYHLDAGAIDLTAFLDFDAIRLGIELLSGAVDITTIQLECVPDGDVTGGWSNHAGPTVENLTATALSADGLALAGADDDDRQAAWDAGYDAALAVSPLLETDPTAMTIQDYGEGIGTSSPAWARSGPNVVGPAYFGDFNLGARKTWVDVSGGWVWPFGDEGVDYIRIPGYTINDGDYAYTRSAANRANKPTSHVAWDDPHVEYTRSNSYEAGDWQDTNVAVRFYLAEEETHASTAPIDWTDAATVLKTLTPLSTTPQMETISLPSSGVFAIYAIAAALDGEEDTKPILPNPAAHVGIYWDAGMSVMSGSTSAPGIDPLTYTLYYDAFSQWDPNASPAGKLKVRLPDNAWRIVGDEAGSDTERLKLQTPDLTWWQEYRATDGAVAVHPLKLYTAGGWVFVGNMTPD